MNKMKETSKNQDEEKAFSMSQHQLQHFSNVVTLSLESRHRFINVATSHIHSGDIRTQCHDIKDQSSNIKEVSQHCNPNVAILNQVKNLNQCRDIAYIISRHQRGVMTYHPQCRDIELSH